MVEPVTTIVAASMGMQFIPSVCKFVYNILKHKRKLKRAKKASREEKAREALRGEGRAQRDAEWLAAMNKQQESMEKERRDRTEAETKRGMEANQQQLKQFVELCIKMFCQMMQQQQQQQQQQKTGAAHCSRCQCHTSQNQSKNHYAKTSECYRDEHQSYAKNFAPYKVELPDDEFDIDKGLLSLFSSSFLQLQDSEFSDSAECVEHPMKDIALLEFLDDQHSDVENMLLLEWPDDDQYSDEENILSMVVATINGSNNPAGIGGSGIDEAKEEGNAYFNDKKFDEAIKCYTKSIDQSPTAAAYGNRAMSYLKLHKYIQAEEDCTEALKIDGSFFKAYARRAIARTKLGHNLKGALEDVEFALEREPNSQEMMDLHSEIKCLLSKGSSVARAKEEGNSYFKEKKFDEAIKCYSEGIKVLPTAEAYANRAMANLKVNKFIEAEEDCTQALKFDLERELKLKVYARRAIARRKRGHKSLGALADVEQALKLKPAEPEMSKLRDELLLDLDLGG